MMKKRIFMPLLFLCISLSASAQFYSARTNVVGLATGNINLEGSMTLSRKVSLHVPVQYNPFIFGKKQFRNFYLSPGLRYWWRESYTGAFISTHAVLGTYSTAGIIDEYKYVGRAFGLGASIGKSYAISDKWNFEWEIGIAGVYTSYKKRINERCGRKLGEADKIMVIPSKFCINFVYLF